MPVPVPAPRHGGRWPPVRPRHARLVRGDRRLRRERASPTTRRSSRRCRRPTRSSFFFSHFSTAFFALAAVVLAVTGAEALYADMGHFGRAPITRAWLILVFPACILSYMGQGALILDDPSANIASPFFLLVPGLGAGGRWSFLATAATVIASQAVITGAFSVARQAAQLGYLPRLRIVHTSEETIGQIYVPWINWLLLVSVLTLVFTFETSTALAFAFGMAVTGTITITTLLFFYIVRHQWRKAAVAGGDRRRLPADRRPALPGREHDQDRARGLAAAADRGDRVHGADHLAAGPRARHRAARARGGLAARVRRRAARSPAIRCSASPARRCSSTATKETAPLAMRASVEHLHALHEHVVILSIETLPVPHVPVGRAARRSTTSATRRRDHPRRAPASATWTSPTSRAVLRLLEHAELEVPARRRRGLVLPVDDRPAPRRRARHEPVAQAPVPGHVAHHRRRRRVLRPPARAHRDHGLAHRGLTSAGERDPSARRGCGAPRSRR